MWEKIKFYATGFLLSALCWGWLFAGSCSAAQLPAMERETVTVSIRQWEELKAIISEQEELLETLETLSTEDDKSLTQLLTDLKAAKQSLRKVESELIAARQSLAIADETLKEQNKSLKILSEQIKRERKIHAQQKGQNTILGVVAGAIIGTLVAH